VNTQLIMGCSLGSGMDLLGSLRFASQAPISLSTRGGRVATILMIKDSDEQSGDVRAALVALGLFGHVMEARGGLKLLFLCEADLARCDLEMPGLAGQKILGMNRRDDDAHPVSS
jgi:hypothetical protein